jgi:hypothetical protein
MHEQQRGGSSKPWGGKKDTTNAKPWPSTSTKQTPPISMSSNQQLNDQLSAMTFTDQNKYLPSQIMTQLHQQTTFGSESRAYSYQHVGAQNATDG